MRFSCLGVTTLTVCILRFTLEYSFELDDKTIGEPTARTANRRKRHGQKGPKLSGADKGIRYDDPHFCSTVDVLSLPTKHATYM